MRILPALASGALLLALVPVAASGQARVLTISLSGVNSATVATVNNGSRQPVGTVAAGRPLALDFSAINAVKGTRYQVAMHQTATGNNTILLLGDGESDRLCDASRQEPGQATQQDTERCVILGTVVAGRTATLGINSTGGMLDAATSNWWAPQLTIGVEYGRTNFTRLSDVACDRQAIPGLSGCTVDDKGASFGAFAEWHLGPRLRLGLGYHHGSYSVTQGSGSSSILHDVSVHAVGSYVRYDVLDGPVVPYVQLRESLYFNKSEIRMLQDLLDTRHQTGFRFGGGGGLDLRIGGNWGARASASYDSGSSRDADSGYWFAFGLTRTL